MKSLALTGLVATAAAAIGSLFGLPGTTQQRDTAAASSDAAAVAAYVATSDSQTFPELTPKPAPLAPTKAEPTAAEVPAAAKPPQPIAHKLPTGPKVRCVVFTIANCRYCTELKKEADKLARLGWKVGTADGADFLFVDVSSDRECKRKYRLGSYPTEVVLDGEEEVARHAGAWDGGSLSAWLNKYRTAPPSRTMEAPPAEPPPTSEAATIRHDSFVAFYQPVYGAAPTPPADEAAPVLKAAACTPPAAVNQRYWKWSARAVPVRDDVARGGFRARVRHRLAHPFGGLFRCS